MVMRNVTITRVNIRQANVKHDKYKSLMFSKL